LLDDVVTEQETTINSLKHRVLAFLYRRALALAKQDQNPFEIRQDSSQSCSFSIITVIFTYLLRNGPTFAILNTENFNRIALVLRARIRSDPQRGPEGLPARIWTLYNLAKVLAQIVVDYTHDTLFP
jgi:hypothetical protein